MILLCMVYDVAFRLEKNESWKKFVISLWNFRVLVFFV